MSGFLGNLSEEQTSTLANFKERIQTDLTDIQKTQMQKEFQQDLFDSTLLRFLRARNFNLDNAFFMFSNCINWRSNFQGDGVCEITEESVENQIKTYKSFYHKTDKDGRPLSYVLTRLHDTKKSDGNELQRFCIYMMEKGRKLLVAPEERCSVIFDLSGVGYRNLDIKFMRFFIDMFEKNYPESGNLYCKCPMDLLGFLDSHICLDTSSNKK